MEGSLSEFRQMAHVSAQMSQDHMQTCVNRRVDGAGLPSDSVDRAAHLVDAATRTAFHFLISNLGGGGSSFFSSAAGPSLVSIALMAQRPYLDARRPSDAAARSATARSSDANPRHARVPACTLQDARAQRLGRTRFVDLRI